MSTWSPPREPPARRAALADWYARVGHFTARSHHHATYVARRDARRHRVHQGERLPAEYSVGHSTRHDRPDIGGCGGLGALGFRRGLGLFPPPRPPPPPR